MQKYVAALDMEDQIITKGIIKILMKMSHKQNRKWKRGHHQPVKTL